MMSRLALLVLGGCSFSVGGSGAPGDGAVDTKKIDAAPDAPPDAMADAPMPLLCPLNYIAIGTSMTKYRPITTLGAYWTHEASCEGDTPTKITHAAVIDDLAEAAAIRAYLLALPPTYRTFGVGAVQAPTATTVGGGWVDFRDRPFDPALWGVYADVQQPDDAATDSGTASSEDHEQNLAFLDLDATGANPYLRDGNGNGNNYAFLCECDGHPVGPVAQGYVDQDRNNPN